MTTPRFSEFRAAAAAGTEAGTISGQAVPYDTLIDQGWLCHIIKPGAFSAQVKDPSRVKILWSHEDRTPIGKVAHLEDQAHALAFTGRILDVPEVPKAQEAMSLIREGIVDELSVGFEWGKWTEETDSTTGITTIVHTKARLREISVVAFGAAGRDAVIKTAAGANGPTVSEWRAILDASPAARTL